MGTFVEYSYFLEALDHFWSESIQHGDQKKVAKATGISTARLSQIKNRAKSTATFEQQILISGYFGIDYLEFMQIGEILVLRKEEKNPVILNLIPKVRKLYNIIKEADVQLIDFILNTVTQIQRLSHERS